MPKLESFSWIILSEHLAYKVTDKTLIRDKETGIPRDIVPFFTESELGEGDEANFINFKINNKQQNISVKRKKDGRHKLVLKDPDDFLNISQMNVDSCEIWFERDTRSKNTFHVYTRTTNSLKPIIPIQEPKAGYSAYMSNQRIGQQYFRKNVIDECMGQCVVTQVREQSPSILIASHIKPWLASSNEEKVDGGNGLLLAPHIDKLFDSGLITFNDERKIVASSILLPEVLHLWKIDNESKYTLSYKQQVYMTFHQNNIFKV